MSLTDADKKWWHPVPQVVSWLARQIPAGAKVLEIGPSRFQFPRATTFVDFAEPIGVPLDRIVKCDVASEPLPFADKEFDFCYIRHGLEDMFNPFLAMTEMSRVAKAGYIETPSPIADMCRGVDGTSPRYRGYPHHRYFVWEHMGELRFVAKYPLCEFLKINEDTLANALRGGPKHWNTYYLWDGAVNWKHRQNGIDYDLMRDYPMVVQDALRQGEASNNAFWHDIPERDEIPAMNQAFTHHGPLTDGQIAEAAHRLRYGPDAR